MIKKKIYYKTLCGEEIASGYFYKHVKSCPVCNKIWNDILNGKYDHVLQTIVDENDFLAKKIQSEVSNKIMNIVGKKMIDDLMNYLIKKKIFPHEWNYECVCGVRTKTIAAYSGHVQKCEIYKKWKKDTEDKLFNLDSLKDALVNRGLTFKEYMEENGVDFEKYKGIYLDGLKLIDKLISEGKMDYEKISVDKLSKNKRIKGKQDKTVMERYGVSNISQSEEIKNKKRETFNKNWNADHWLKSSHGKILKAKQLQDKYGVDNVSKLEWVKEKKRLTFRKHYGFDNIFQDVEFIKQKVMEKYGVDNVVFVDEINENRMKRTFDNYGFAYDFTIGEKTFKVLSKHEEDFLKYFVDANNIKHIKVNEEILKFKNDPTQKYHDIYLADIYISNFVIEIKSKLYKDIEKSYKAAIQTNNNYILYCDKPRFIIMTNPKSDKLMLYSNEYRKEVIDFFEINKTFDNKKITTKILDHLDGINTYVHLISLIIEVYLSKIDNKAI